MFELLNGEEEQGKEEDYDDSEMLKPRVIQRAMMQTEGKNTSNPLGLRPQQKLDSPRKKRPSSANHKSKIKRAAERIECEIYKDLIGDSARKLSNEND